MTYGEYTRRRAAGESEAALREEAGMDLLTDEEVENPLASPPNGFREKALPPRGDVLAEASRLITGDRNNQYGPPTQDFQRTAGALTSMGYRRLDAQGRELPLVPSDIAIIVGMVKISRLMHQRTKRDNWTDLAGYTGCGYECSLEEDFEFRAAQTERDSA